MSPYLLAASILLSAVVPLMLFVVRASVAGGLVALNLGGTLATVVLLLIAAGTGREPFFDLALVSAVLSFAGGLAFARFVERWL